MPRAARGSAAARDTRSATRLIKRKEAGAQPSRPPAKVFYCDLLQELSRRPLGLVSSGTSAALTLRSRTSAALAFLAAGALFLPRGLLCGSFYFFAQFTHKIRVSLLPGCGLSLSFLPLWSVPKTQRERPEPKGPRPYVRGAGPWGRRSCSWACRSTSCWRPSCGLSSGN
jgi:hypothetical protein